MQFDRDQKKAASNLKKHSVSFDEAETVFGDSLAAVFLDEDHSIEEKREIIIGYSANQRLLVVSFTEGTHEVIRIISARRADPDERRNHENESAR
ncbi:MAG: BrnT family toxin [Pyrinomonadaceae bacterium]